MASGNDLNSSYSQLESRGNLRFRTDGYNMDTITTRARSLAGVLVQRLPSNYSKAVETNIGVMYRVIAEELEKYEDSLIGIDKDNSFETVRAESMYQNFASYLFLGSMSAISPSITEDEYRSYLQKVKDAYLRGSKKSSIEESLADILGLTVVLRELYLEARLPNSPFGVKDTHRMLCDIMMDDTWDRPVGDLLQEISYYTSLIRPAHTLLENRLVWKENYAIAGGCFNGDLIGSDANGAMDVYKLAADHSAPRCYLLRLMSYVGADSNMVNSYTAGTEQPWVLDTIATIDIVNKLIYLTSGATLVLGSDSTFYNHDSVGDYRVLLSDLVAGADIQYQGLTIKGLFQFYGGSTGGSNDYYPGYTGFYPGSTGYFHGGTGYFPGETGFFPGSTGSVYDNTPPEILEDPSRAFDPEYNRKPRFQDYVIKEMDPQGRFPALWGKCPGALADRWVTDLLEPMYEDLRDDCNYPAPKRYSVYVAGDTGYAPTPNQQMAQFVDGTTYYVPDTHPFLGSSGAIAAASDLQTWLDGVGTTGIISSVDSVGGMLYLASPVDSGSLLRIDYWYSSRYPYVTSYTYEAPISPVSAFSVLPDVGSTIAVVGGTDVVKHLNWPFHVQPAMYGDDRDIQIDKAPVLTVLGALATTADVDVYINGVLNTSAVESLEPLLGHLRLTFVPPPGTTVEVVYHYTEKKRSYALVPDSPSATYDAEYGNFYGYSLVPDYPNDFDTLQPIESATTAKTFGYRYRAYKLSDTAVLNSADTLTTNDYTVPGGVSASYANSSGLVGRNSLMFSPEHLTDKSRYITLDDTYLKKPLDPATKLNYGVPTFQQTFTDNAGLIRSMPLSSVRENNQVLQYSDLRLEVTESGDTQELSTICDSRTLGLDLTMREEYFPNREMRLNDYLDYVEKVEVLQISNGTLAVMRGTNLVKSIGTNWSMVPRGSVLAIVDHKYTVASVVNSDTILVIEEMSLATGEYEYSLTMEEAPQVKVNLGELWRTVSVNVSSMQPGYIPGNDWIVDLQMPDPDPDPYPYTDPRGLTGQISVGDAADYHGYTGTYGNTGLPISVGGVLGTYVGPTGMPEWQANAEKMVKWRNWDQDMVLCSYVGATGINPDDYPGARIRPGGTGAPWSTIYTDVYVLGYRGDSPGSTGFLPGYTGQVAPGYGPGGTTGSLPYTTLLELVGTEPESLVNQPRG